jgi:hypothetical protein
MKTINITGEPSKVLLYNLFVMNFQELNINIPESEPKQLTEDKPLHEQFLKDNGWVFKRGAKNYSKFSKNGATLDWWYENEDSSIVIRDVENEITYSGYIHTQSTFITIINSLKL